MTTTSPAKPATAESQSPALVVTTAKRQLTVTDSDMRDALRAFTAVLSKTRPEAEVARQLSKMVQFGLYDSEKTTSELAKAEAGPARPQPVAA